MVDEVFFLSDVNQWCICYVGLQVNRASSNMAAASYDQLLRQVEVLKMENSNLRQELQDNSNHLTKLETEASNMKVGAFRTTRMHRNGCFIPVLSQMYRKSGRLKGLGFKDH